VLASRLGSLPEVVHAGHSGLLFDPGSSQDLAAVLRQVAASDALCVELGTGARKLYDDTFNPHVTTDRLVSIYQDDFPDNAAMSLVGAELRR
jgi:glycosyltransferase involved in cell wall biosynthesis